MSQWQTFVLASLSPLTLVYGVSIDRTPQLTPIHTETWLVQYDPGTRAISQTVAFADSGSTDMRWTFNNSALRDGDVVELVVTGNAHLSANFQDFDLRPLERLGIADQRANYLGGSSIVETTLWSPTLSYEIPLLGNLSTGVGEVSIPFTISIAATVFGDYLSAGNPLRFTHVLFAPTDLQVVEPLAPAAALIRAFARLDIESVSFASVPDGGATGMLLAIGVLGLAVARRRHGESFSA